MRKKYKIIVADDHPAMRESVADAIADAEGARMEVVAHAADGVSAVELVRKHRPDLVVLDIGLPRLDGLQAAREIKKIDKAIVVLIFSMYDDQARVVEAIRAGADDYVCKHEAGPAEIVARVARALEKRTAGQDRVHEHMVSALRRIGDGQLDFGVARLTEAELEVLTLAAHRGYSMKEIAASLGRDGRELSELTVRKHFEHIYEKLGAQSQAHAVCLAVKYGLIGTDDAEPSPR